MKYDFINLSQKTIDGIKNPNLILVGTVLDKNSKFIVKVDNKIIKHKINFFNYNGDFILKAKLPFNVKKVVVYIMFKKQKYMICKIKSNVIRRFANKVKINLINFSSYLKSFFITLKKGIVFLWKEYRFIVPLKMFKKYWIDFWQKVERRSSKGYLDPFDIKEYNQWILKFEKKNKYVKQKYEPLISVLIPTYNVSSKLLSECLDSILNQEYTNFEICVVDDCSKNEETLKTLKKYSKKDNRIKVKYRSENGNISNATNDALKMAKGEFIALVDNDDIIAKDALGEVVKSLNKNKDLDFIYSDEDKLSLEGIRCYPHFKPDWSPDTLFSNNYISHLGVIRKSLVEEVNGEEVGLEGAQDYDLYLKVTEKTTKIHHIPKILYHWRMVEGSTSITIDSKNYAIDRGKKAIENALKRRNIKGVVETDKKTTYYRIKYEIKGNPLVSIIIPTKDQPKLLKSCINSIYKKTKYSNFEIIIVNNNSEEKETFKILDYYRSKYENFKVIDANFKFNYSKINNIAVNKAKGSYICLLNNDTEVIDEDWLDIMLGYAMQKHVGAVGPKLLYKDNTIQHAGIVLGLGGVASHAYIGSSVFNYGMYGRLNVPYNYAGVTAACLLVSKKKYLEVNGLEEDLEVAYNDVDFNLKLLEKGYYNVFLPQVKLYHYESKTRGLDTTPKKLKKFEKEQQYMYDKWMPLIKNDPYYNINFTNKISFYLPIDNKENRDSIYIINNQNHKCK